MTSLCFTLGMQCTTYISLHYNPSLYGKDILYFSVGKYQPWAIFSLLHLDAILIEWEPYNRLARKSKRQLNVAQQNSNISEMWETGFKNLPRRTPSVWGPATELKMTEWKSKVPYSSSSQSSIAALKDVLACKIQTVSSSKSCELSSLLQ